MPSSTNSEEVKIVVRRKGACEVTLTTPGYEVYVGDSYGQVGVFVGRTPVTFYVEPIEERGTLWFRKYITVKKNGEIVKGCLGTLFVMAKELKEGDLWTAPVISPPSGGIFRPHKGTETGLTFDIDDEWVYGWIDFAGEADRIDVYIDGEHKGVILEAALILYLAPGTYRVEHEAAGVRCRSNIAMRNGVFYHTSDIAIKAGEETIIDVDMYSSPLDPPPQYVLDAAIMHLQELGWKRLPSIWLCEEAHRKSQITQEWCYTSEVPEVCDYEKATHYWLASHPGFVFPETEICKVNIETPGYSIEIATQPGLTVPSPSTPLVFNCASIPISEGVWECTKYITIYKPAVGVIHTCSDAKIVFRKVVPGDWSIDEEKSSSCIEVFDITSTSPTSISIAIKESYQPLAGHIILSESYIPSTLYLRALGTFNLSVLNTGAITAEYKASVTFEGVDIEHEEVFASDWSGAIVPGGTVTLPVEVKLSKEAIPAGQETASYSIYTRLEAV